MTTYKFTSPTGEIFEVDVANGVAEAEARRIFDQQFNAGALNNLGVGQALQGLESTAKNALGSLAKLTNVPVSAPVSPAAVLKMIPATKDIGSLNPQQVTGLLGQAASAVGQAANAVSLDKGIGQFGLTPQQLEQQGFLKTGTVSQFIGQDPSADWTKVLANPGVWSGKEGVNGLAAFLAAPNLQNLTQQNIMSQGLAQLKTLGVTNGITDPQQLGALVQGAAKFGADTMAKWTQGAAPPDLAASITDLAKNAQFGVDLASNKLPSLPTADIAGIIDSVKRKGLDSSIKSTLDDPKIPPIEYGPIERQPLEADTARSFLDQWNQATADWLSKLNGIKAKADGLLADMIKIESDITKSGQEKIPRAEWNIIDTKLQAIRQEFNVELSTITDGVKNLKSQAPANISQQILETYNSLVRLQNVLQKFIVYLRELVKQYEALIGT